MAKIKFINIKRLSSFGLPWRSTGQNTVHAVDSRSGPGITRAVLIFAFKMLFLVPLTLNALNAEEKVPTSELKEACLTCHIQQQIPSEMIYRRYLLKYSSTSVIKQKIYAYLKVPSTQTSIMHAHTQLIPPSYGTKYTFISF